MLLVATFVVGLIVLRLGGADLSRLNHLRLRWWPLAVLALVTQTAIISVWPTGWRDAHLVVNLATYAAIGAVLWVNRRIPWLWLVALGTASNTVAIAANGGVMPASPRALALSHLSVPAGFANSAAVVHARVQFLGDVFPTPAWLPLHNVASIGDFLILAGALLVVARQAGRPHPASSRLGTGSPGDSVRPADPRPSDPLLSGSIRDEVGAALSGGGTRRRLKGHGGFGVKCLVPGTGVGAPGEARGRAGGA